MSYSVSNFLLSKSSSDYNIVVQNSLGELTTIKTFNIVNIFSINNLIKIKLKGQDIVTLDFNTQVEAIAALQILKEQWNTARQLVPYVIDKDIANYVAENYLTGPNITFTGTYSTGDGRVVAVSNGVIVSIT